MIEKFTSIEEVHDKVKFGLGLERVVKLDDKWTFNLLKNISLGYKNYGKRIK
jgi:hypothetical protein